MSWRFHFEGASFIQNYEVMFQKGVILLILPCRSEAAATNLFWSSDQQDTKEYPNQRGTKPEFLGVRKGGIKGEVKRGEVVRD